LVLTLDRSEGSASRDPLDADPLRTTGFTTLLLLLLLLLTADVFDFITPPSPVTTLLTG